MQDFTHSFMTARASVRDESPLIHSITSPIAINDCANAVLALGAKSIMAEHPREVARIARIARALTVSLANITDARAESIRIAGREKRAVIDLVGITCSPFRMELAKDFIRDCHPAVIKGNVSEIRAAAGVDFNNSGIDRSSRDPVPKKNSSAPQLLEQVMTAYAAAADAVILASGEVDLIASPDGAVCFVENGSPAMANVTGTGCILTCIIGTYLSVTDPFTASALAAVTLGIAGELADASHGLGTYHIGLIDALSTMSDEQVNALAKISSFHF